MTVSNSNRTIGYKVRVASTELHVQLRCNCMHHVLQRLGMLSTTFEVVSKATSPPVVRTPQTALRSNRLFVLLCFAFPSETLG